MGASCTKQSASRSVLECHSLTFGYRDRTVLEDVSLEIEQEDILGVIGPNGSGKTTLIRLLAGGLKPNSGAIMLEGRPLDSYASKDTARRIAVVEQEEPSDFGFTVREMVALGRFPHHGGLHFEDERDLQVVNDAMNRAGVAALSERPFDQLSGGERQKVRIARALAQEPSVMLLDEPTNHLDLYATQALTESLRTINRDGVAVLMVSHDINFVSRLCNRVKVLRQGRFIASGGPSEVVTERVIKEAFRVRVRLIEGNGEDTPTVIPLGRAT